MSKSADARPVIPRIAGLLTQLCGAGCVLVGTVAFALLIDQMDGVYLAILLSWIGAGMAALVCGGLAGRPSPTALVLSAALNASFAGVLFAVASRLPVWLRILSGDDAANASTAVISIGVTAGVAMLASLVATPVALRYWRVSGPRPSRELPAAHFGPGDPAMAMAMQPQGYGAPPYGGPSVGAMPQGPGGYAYGPGMAPNHGPGMAPNHGPGVPGMSPVAGQDLQPSSTAPGFPPPVTGAFQISPADSGEIVMLPGGGKPPPSAHPLRPAVAQQPRSVQSVLPQQPAPPQPSPSPYAPPHAQQAHSPYAPPHAQQAHSPYAPPQLPLPAPPRELTPPAPPATAAQLFRAESTSSPYAPALRSDSAAPFTAAPRPDSVPSSFSPMISPRIEPQPPLRREHGPAFGRPDSSFGPPHDEHTPPPYYTGYPMPGAPHAPRHPDHTPPPGSFAYAPPHRDHTPPPPYQLAGVPNAVPAHLDRTPAPMMAPGFGDPAFAQQPFPHGPPGFSGGPAPFGPQAGQPPFGPQTGQPQPFPPPPMVPPGYAPSFGGQPGFRADPTPPLHHAPADFGPAAPPRSRRLLWIAAAGLVIGGLTGVIVMASGDEDGPSNGQAIAGDPSKPTKPTTPNDKPPVAGAGVPTVPVSPPPTTEPGLTVLPAPRTPTELLEAVHQAAARADVAALKTLLAPSAFSFGVRASSINRGVDAVTAALAADLGEVPAEGFTITPVGTEIGEEGNHAWIAEELDVTGEGTRRRRFAVTLLAAAVEGRWRVVALHWAVRVPDDEIERLVEQGDLHIPEGFDDKLDAPNDVVEAFRAAFASTESYSLAISPRASSFNFGSAPGERLRGGTTIRRVFKKLRADIRLSDGVMVASSNTWDPTIPAPTVAWAAANVEFSTRKSRRILRVLSIMVRENDEWRLVQTQWSDGA